MIIYVHLLSKISPSLKNEKGSVLLPLRKNEVCMDEDLKFIPMYKLLVTEAMTNLDSILKKERHHCVDEGLHSQSYDFSINHV